MLWGFVNPVKKTDTSYLLQDTVRAVGKTRENNQRVVLMGDNYWYFIDADKTPELLPLLNTKLTKDFVISNNKPPIIQLTDDNKKFNARFDLYYHPQNEQEEKTLKTLGFELDKGYQKSYPLNGEVYLTNKNISQAFQFDTSLPLPMLVNIKMRIKPEVSYSKVIGNIALTPFTLLADIVLAPIVVVEELIK